VTGGVLKISMMFRREDGRHNGHRERERAHGGVTDRDDVYARVAASGCRDGVVATSSDVISTSYPYLGSPLAGRPPRPRRSSSSVPPVSLSLALSRQPLKIYIKVRFERVAFRLIETQTIIGPIGSSLIAVHAISLIALD